MADCTVIDYKGFKFLITKTPSANLLDSYIKELKKYNTKCVIRVCDPSYNPTSLNKAGIVVHDITIPDGAFPTEQQLEVFFEILRTQYFNDPEPCVATHCVAGLGRGPVMVAAALIELGYSYEDAVELIREKRRGAINSKQLEYLSKYKPQSRLGNDRRKSCYLQ